MMTENKSFLESMAETQKPESFAEEKFEYIKDMGKTKKLATLGILAVVIVAAVFVVTYFTGRVNVPNLVGMTLDDANIWAQRSKVSLVVKSEYNFDINERIVLAQEVPEGDKVKKNSIMPVTVSLGADPEEVIAVPDIKSMTLNEVEDWVNDNKLTGVRIETANSDVVEANHVIGYSFTDGTEENFKRKNRITITVSSGSATISETVIVDDFINQKAVAVMIWGIENDVSITLTEAFDPYIAAGTVIAQSIKKGTEIKRTEGITVVISKGKSVTVPNFAAMLKDEASTWAKLNNVTLTIIERYTDSYDKGKIYSQSISAGQTMKEGDEIKLFYSMGKVEVPSFVGKTRLDILNWQQDINAKGADIILTLSEASGDRGTAGTIISQSIKNDLVSTGTAITVVVSKGMRLVTPDFAGMTEEDVQEVSKEIGMKVLYDYQRSNIIEGGFVISQSIAKGTIITDADTVTVAISLAITDVTSRGKSVKVPDFAAMLKEEASTWAKLNNVTLTFIEKYNNSYDKGKIYDQSINTGQTMTEGDIINLYVSLGRVEVPSFIGKTKLDILNWQQDVNAKGANISLIFSEATGDKGTAGTIISQSIKNDLAYTGTEIMVVISQGMRFVTPDFVGMTEEDVQELSQQMGIRVLYEYMYSDTEAGFVIFQSVVQGTVITDADTVTVVISM